jgi:hypothetical protein
MGYGDLGSGLTFAFQKNGVLHQKVGHFIKMKRWGDEGIGGGVIENHLRKGASLK